MLAALDALVPATAPTKNGVYLDLEGRSGELLVTSSLDKSGLKLLKYEEGGEGNNGPSHAVIFATPTGVKNLRKKITDFGEGEPRSKNGKVGRPPNADLVQSIGHIAEAGLRRLWRGNPDSFPTGLKEIGWEVWIDRNEAERFLSEASKRGIQFSSDRLSFPEEIVVFALSTIETLAFAIKDLGAVTGLSLPSSKADYYDAMDSSEQSGEAQALLKRTNFTSPAADVVHVTIMDTGVGLANPLISPALSSSDRFAAEPAWGLEDNHGHGTSLAGMALYGDLQTALRSSTAIQIPHRLEAVKIIPDAGGNPYHLLGTVTEKGVDAVEKSEERRRVFTLATTTSDDTPHSGAPTSWSTVVDQLAAGAAGQTQRQRLFVVSAGNTVQNNYRSGDYISFCHLPDHEIEAPAQAWNAITVGAYTEKTVLEKGTKGRPVAEFGDLSPSSRTASWSSKWPIKPDVVLEGGNWLNDGVPPPMRHPDLMPLSTSNQFPIRTFNTFDATSAATGIAAGKIAELWADYPNLWPETVRALFVSSARWTDQMNSYLPANPGKRAYKELFQRYGYGVPNISRARRSASNALTLIIQDELKPYRRDPKTKYIGLNQLKLFKLPWPTQTLRKLGSANVNVRVALSTFPEPNPSEASRGRKLSYASHSLRFKLQKPNEKPAEFLARLNALNEDELLDFENFPIPNTDDDGWLFGTQQRDVGSLQIDELDIRVSKASDISRRSHLAVYPVGGWWKTQTRFDPSEKSVRFALIIEVATSADVDLYTEVQSEIDIMTKTPTTVQT